MESCTLLTCLIIVIQLMSASAGDTTICRRNDCICDKELNRITCEFKSDEEVEIKAGQIPKKTEELELRGGAKLSVQTGAFTSFIGGDLKRIGISNVTEVLLARRSFINVSTSQLFVDVKNCYSVTIESEAFKSLQRGPLVLVIVNSSIVLIQSASLSWIQRVQITNSSSLTLQELAFSQEPTHDPGRHGPSTQIILERVQMKEILQNTFKSAMSELRMVESKIGTIRRDAFRTVQLDSVMLLDSSIGTIEEGGFSTETFIQQLILSNTSVRSLESNSVRSAITKLSIQHSRITEIKPEAFCLTVATVTLSSSQFDNIKTRGFVLKDWNRISLNNNSFLRLEDNAFKSMYASNESADHLLNFTNNSIQSIGKNSLDFDIQDSWRVEIADNRFYRPCNCDFDTWLALLMKGTNRTVAAFRNTSLCQVTQLLAECHEVPEGFVLPREFDDICASSGNLQCGPTSKNKVPNYDDSSLLSLIFSKNVDTHTFLIMSLLIFFVCLASSLLVFWSLRWLKHTRVRSKGDLLKSSRSFSRFSLLSRFFSTGLTSASSTHSISRMSIHEYAELHRQKLHEEEELGLGIPLEDKATQTLPEEFTQELLQSLKEKLEDPDKSVEARVIIEHLYDMIKVEESCDNNVIDSFDVEELYKDNVYDTIRPPRRHRNPNDRTFRSKVSVGTRVPSPDKLEPVKLCKTAPQLAKTKPTICEYNDPRDVERHVYLELPPKTSPPPPYSAPLGESVRFHPTVLNSVLCDYNEPKDTAVHIYSEVPVSMVNRPLPVKPGRIGEEMEEATSSGYSSR